MPLTSEDPAGKIDEVREIHLLIQEIQHIECPLFPVQNPVFIGNEENLKKFKIRFKMCRI